MINQIVKKQQTPKWFGFSICLIFLSLSIQAADVVKDVEKDADKDTEQLPIDELRIFAEV